ncbi:hypothetical protein AK812_SmicGene17514 [Symbiodinium microadriaticum]|uniref:Uncharacterized protein n=1 Tax=Symbiodinium microadriaticum TaxID=2951 RepID=A0A1Q9DXH4_SYMMI|nr:hypothetical protein AK812_SmicGene17514 [Symbiodinium microadriaticum]
MLIPGAHGRSWRFLASGVLGSDDNSTYLEEARRSLQAQLEEQTTNRAKQPAWGASASCAGHVAGSRFSEDGAGGPKKAAFPTPLCPVYVDHDRSSHAERLLLLDLLQRAGESDGEKVDIDTFPSVQYLLRLARNKPGQCRHEIRLCTSAAELDSAYEAGAVAATLDIQAAQLKGKPNRITVGTIAQIVRSDYEVGQWYYLDHHHAHALLGFYDSPFQSALIISYDGEGIPGLLLGDSI